MRLVVSLIHVPRPQAGLSYPGTLGAMVATPLALDGGADNGGSTLGCTP